jgi:integrase
MFTAIDQANEAIVANNAARRALEHAARTAWRSHDAAARRAARAKLAGLPPYQRPVYAATQQRIRATLRSALSDAAPQDLITVNVAKLVKLASGRAPKPLMWTEERVARWRKTGQRPCPVMVWNTAQTVAFLQYVSGHRLYGLYHLIAFTGLRRGEACGLRWSDLDLTRGTLTVAQQIVQLGWATEIGRPKSEAGDRTIALARETVTELKVHRTRQNRDRLAHGAGWLDTDLVFTNPDGSPLHPADVTKQFLRLTRDADLPPIRLHDLRHGTATHAHAAGIDIEVVQEMLGHSSEALTADTYTSVLPELQREAADAIAALLTSAANTPGRTGRTEVRRATLTPPSQRPGNRTGRSPLKENAQVRGMIAGGPPGDRTPNPRIKSPLLCQLS